MGADRAQRHPRRFFLFARSLLQTEHSDSEEIWRAKTAARPAPPLVPDAAGQTEEAPPETKKSGICSKSLKSPNCLSDADNYMSELMSRFLV